MNGENVKMKYVKFLLNEELDKNENCINHKLEQIQELTIHQQKLEDQLISLKEIRKDLLKALESVDEG